MDGAFEGDLIRPLGVVTLYFGYAEAEVDAVLEALRHAGLVGVTPEGAPLGQKLAALREELTRLHAAETGALVAVLDEGRPLIELRNMLVHSCILAKGRVRPSDKSLPEITVTPSQLIKLANDIFDWKERLSAASRTLAQARGSRDG